MDFKIFTFDFTLLLRSQRIMELALFNCNDIALYLSSVTPDPLIMSMWVPNILILSSMISISLSWKSWSYILQCDAPYRGHPTNFSYKLANQDTRIWLTVTVTVTVSDATMNYLKHAVFTNRFVFHEERRR